MTRLNGALKNLQQNKTAQTISIFYFVFSYYILTATTLKFTKRNRAYDRTTAGYSYGFDLSERLRVIPPHNNEPGFRSKNYVCFFFFLSIFAIEPERRCKTTVEYLPDNEFHYPIGRPES